MTPLNERPLRDARERAIKRYLEQESLTLVLQAAIEVCHTKAHQLESDGEDDKAAHWREVCRHLTEAAYAVRDVDVGNHGHLKPADEAPKDR